MKAVDPTIKIGVVAVTGEDSTNNGYSAHPAVNLRTNTNHYGWTPVMLATMKSLGVLPDFLIYHRYDGAPGSESDSVLLQAALTWGSDAANLRQMLSDYLGASGPSVELVVTENNSVYGNPGKQSTSLVNGLYMADSTANVMQTELNGLMWWDFHNGQDKTQNNSAALYGWRLYGDYGVESSSHDRYPTFYVAKLLSHFARGGDTVVTVATGSSLLSAYAVKRVDGSLSILVLNKSASATQTANFTLVGYAPQATATVYSYGMPQDTAAQTQPGSAAADVAVTSITNAAGSFSASFGPYSATVLALSNPPAAPTSGSQPVSQTIAAGRTVEFSFPAAGSPTPTFQWSLNGVPIALATSPTLVVSGASSANAGTYTCTATNASGSLTSSAAVLNVASTPNPGRLVNISCRAQVGTGASILIAGYAIGGAGTSGTESVLIRGSGPALVPFNVSGTLPDPLLGLYLGSKELDSNSAWAGNAQITSTGSAVGAFAWNTPTSKDAALLESLQGGAYTAQISGKSGDTGVALAEVYDATPSGGYSVTTPRLVNISARVQVGTGGGILISGFVIGGSTSETVLIRASGPALVPFGVSGTLPDPKLQLYDSSQNLVASNNGWGGRAEIAGSAAAVGAFAWPNPLSNDSAILVTLPPGAYTAQVSGASGDTGVALVEVYEVQ
jgi:hypothetical protein